MPPLKALVGDVDFFLSLVDAVKVWRATSSSDGSIIIGAGRGTTGTHELAKMVGRQRPTVHWAKWYDERIPRWRPMPPSKNNEVIAAFHKLVGKIKKWREAGVSGRGVVGSSTAEIGALFVDYVKTCLRFNITGFFDSPFPEFFTEFYLATCPHNKVVLGTRDSLSWATSRIKHHGTNKSKTGFVCPHAASPAIRDPFSYTQCAHFDTIRRAQTWTASGDGPGRGAAEYASRPNTSLILNSVSAPALAKAFEKYDAFVARMVPQDRLLRINLFTSAQLRPNASTEQQQANRIAWTDENNAVVERFVQHKVNLQAQKVMVFAAVQCGNELPHVREWVEYHLGIGFSHLFVSVGIAGGLPEDGTIAVLEEYPEVTVIYPEMFRQAARAGQPHPKGHQGTALAVAMAWRKSRGRPAWIFGIDMDEYVMPLDPWTNLPNLLAHYDVRLLTLSSGAQSLLSLQLGNFDY